MSEIKFAISEAAKQLHVEAHVLRYWEEELGLHIGRTEMGHRYYTEDDIQLFRCIKKLKNEGVLLRELKTLIPELTMIRHQKAEWKTSDSSAESPKIAPATPKLTHSDAPREATEKTAEEATEATAAKVTEEADDTTQTNSDGANSEAAPQEMPMTGAPQTAPEMPMTGVPQSTPEMPTTGAPQTISDPGSDTTPQEMPDTVSDFFPGTTPETASTGTAPAEVIEVTRLEQVRSLFGEVINEAITSNNRTLERNISRRVTSNVCREIDLLFQVQEQQDEEHFRKLDNLIRQQQAYRRESAEVTPLGALKKLFT